MSRLEEPNGPDPFTGGLPTLEGERVCLRMPRSEDAADVLRVFGDPEAMHYWSHGPLPDLDAARRYLDGIDAGCRDRTLFQWAITEPPNDRLVGTVTLYQWDRQCRRAEIGFMLARDRWGKGLATEAVRAVLAFAFDSEGMDLHRVEADVDPANEASLGLLHRVGFLDEGRLRDRWFTYGRWSDSILLGLLRSDYANGQSPS